MHIPTMRLITTVAALSSLLVIGQGQFGASGVHAQTWSTNPGTYNTLKAPVSTMGLNLLARTHSGGKYAGTSDGGDGNGTPPAYGGSLEPVVQSNATGTLSTGSGPQGGVNQTPGPSIDFTDDKSAAEQNETSVTVQQTTTTAPTTPYTTDHVVGGDNDSRGFVYRPDLGCGVTPGTWCYPARNCVSLSGFSVSLHSANSLDKGGCLPWVNGTYQPFGDPSLDRDTSGNVFYGSLGFDYTAGSSNNGIIIERSTPALFDPSNPCKNSLDGSNNPTVNPCWKGRVIQVTSQGTNTSSACDPTHCLFADKEWVAVDRYSTTAFNGDVYVSWNGFTTAGPNNGESHIYLSRCHPDNADPTGFSSCTTPAIVSMPSDVYTGGGSYLTVTRDGHVLVAYENFGTASTFYPVDYRVAVIAPGGQTVQGYINVAHLTQTGDASTAPCLPNNYPSNNNMAGTPCEPNMYVDAAAGVAFRLPAFFKIDVDRSLGSAQNTVYTTYELCDLPQFRPLSSSGNIIYTGNCPKSTIMVSMTKLTFSSGSPGFTNSPIVHNDITPVQSLPNFGNHPVVKGQQFFPHVTVDERSGMPIVVYNSTQDDQFQNMDSVYAQGSADGGKTFIALPGSNNGGKITSFPYQIQKDPSYYFGQGAPFCGDQGPYGCFGYAPQNGDYLQGVAYFGRLYTLYTGTYLQKGWNPDYSVDIGTFRQGTYPMNQDDPFLNQTAYFPGQ